MCVCVFVCRVPFVEDCKLAPVWDQLAVELEAEVYVAKVNGPKYKALQAKPRQGVSNHTVLGDECVNTARSDSRAAGGVWTKNVETDQTRTVLQGTQQLVRQDGGRGVSYSGHRGGGLQGAA